MDDMIERRRLYGSVLEEHLGNLRQMAFVSGPRQVGKTTTCRALADSYANWDDPDDRESILAGSGSLAKLLGLDHLSATAPVALFDEFHKYGGWKQLLKGLFDAHAEDVRIVVTGSSRLDAYRRGGDSLMGRYFLYRMHPFSVAETTSIALPDAERIVRDPEKPVEAEFAALWEHGGFPEPFLRRDRRFSRRWQRLRAQQLLREDVRSLTQIQQLDQIAMLAKLLGDRSAQQLVYGNLAGLVRASSDTVIRWVETLSNLHYGFLLRPWFRSVARSLRKEPKWFLRDWSQIEDKGARAETLVACHLLKAVEGWTDLGFGEFQLAYLRDKDRREVDFIVIRDGEPWFVAEVKHSATTLSPALHHFQEQTGAPHAFQVVLEMDYVDADCFERPRGPLVVPARTLLSQLL